MPLVSGYCWFGAVGVSVTNVCHGPSWPLVRSFQYFSEPRWNAGYEIPFWSIIANIAYWPCGPYGIRLFT